jgi:hypothetical protein
MARTGSVLCTLSFNLISRITDFLGSGWPPNLLPIYTSPSLFLLAQLKRKFLPEPKELVTKKYPVDF